MAKHEIRSQRLKISPGGMITLPTKARRALQMRPGHGAQVGVGIDENCVIIRSEHENAGLRISPRGQMEMRGDAAKLLMEGEGRRYWIEVDEDSATVTLHPTRSTS